MLKHLHIQNYALISRLDIDFGEGFSVLTGETGAGKSIILGALALVLVLSVGLYWALGFRWIRAVVSLGIAVPLSIGLSSVGQDALYYMRTSKKGNDHNE